MRPWGIGHVILPRGTFIINNSLGILQDNPLPRCSLSTHQAVGPGRRLQGECRERLQCGKGAQCPHINPVGMCCCLALSWWPHGIMKISTVTATTNKRTHGIVAHVSILASDLLQDAPAAGHTCCQTHLLPDASVPSLACLRSI